MLQQPEKLTQNKLMKLFKNADIFKMFPVIKGVCYMINIYVYFLVLIACMEISFITS